jgi:hypothetical protein
MKKKKKSSQSRLQRAKKLPARQSSQAALGEHTRSPQDQEIQEAVARALDAGEYLQAAALLKQIPSSEPALLAQKKHLVALWLQSLYHHGTQENPLEGLAEVQRQLAALKDFVSPEEAGWQELLCWVHHLHLAQLWQEGKMEEILATAQQNPSDHPSVLEIYAKAGYQCLEARGAEESGEADICLWLDYWLSALFHPFVRQQLRSLQLVETLLAHAGQRLEKYVAQREEKKWLLAYWRNNLDLMQTVHALGGACLVPAVALSLGKTAALSSLIQEREAAFPSTQAWLAAGAAYSPAAAALLALRQHRHEEALHLLGPMQASACPFVRYAQQHIALACAEHFLHSENYKEAKELLLLLLSTFPKDPKLRGEVRTLLASDFPPSPEWMELCVQVCTLLHQQENSLVHRQGLALALTRNVIFHFEHETEVLTVLLKQTEEALALDPEDSLVQFTHKKLTTYMTSL